MNHFKNITTRITTLSLLLTAGIAQGQFVPITLTPGSYNQDMIVEVPTDNPTTATLDSGTANTGGTYYEQGFNSKFPATGLPVAGSTFTSLVAADHSYTMAPSYKANDVVLIDPTVTSATLTLTNPAAYSALSFLVTSGNGSTTFGYTVHHQDGSTDTGTFLAPDWFFNTPVVFNAQGRVTVTSRAMDNVNNNQPRVYAADVTLLNTTNPVTSIDFTYSSGTGHGVLFAVSGSTGAEFTGIPVTGYNKDVIVEASALAMGRYTTASVDNGLANVGNGWYAKGFNTGSTTTGIPAAGSTITSAAASDHQFTFAPSYATNDVVYIDFTHGGTLTMASPTNFSALSFLLSAGHGPVSINAIVHHMDTTTENFTFSAKDWFNNTPVAYTVGGRIAVDSGVFDISGSNPRLYTTDIALANISSPVTSISLLWNSSATNAVACIFAVSGKAGAVPPAINIPPSPRNGVLGSTVHFTAGVGGTAPLSYRWQGGTAGTFADLADGANISGSGTTNLAVSNLSFADVGSYRLVVTNSVGSVTSSAAYLGVISAATDITAPSDAITGYMGSSPVNEDVPNAIDNTTTKYLNYGGNGGFAPFVGPVGLMVTPGMGSTVVTGLRIYTANDAIERDPTDYLLEGSNDGGASFATISSGSLALPDDRNNPAALNPLGQINEEVAFANGTAYTTYRLSFNNVKNNAAANSMQVGEIELLGTAATTPSVTLSLQSTGGQLQLQWSQGSLLEATNLAGPWTTNTATSPYVVVPTEPQKFFRVIVQ
jgi:hypothetical protein